MDIWVDAALELDETSLKKMDCLVRAQNKRRETDQAATAPSTAS